MNAWFGHSFLNEALSLRLAETLLHFLWQGTVIGLVIWLVNLLVPRARSTLRYRLNALALLLMVLCVPLTFVLLPARELASAQAASTVPASVPESAPPDSLAATNDPAEPPLDLLPVVPSQTHEPVVEASADADDSLPVSRAVKTQTPETHASESSYVSRMKSIAPYATTIYVVGVMIMLLRLLMAIRGGQRLRAAACAMEDSTLLESVRRLSQQIGLKVAPVVATCSRIGVPVVVGIVKPMILLPPSLVSSMSPAQLEAVLSHELAHLRRLDLVINLLQRLIEALLFFHPAVWYVSHRVSIERENCCDDLVMSHGCDRLTYADALLRMAEVCTDGSSQPALESAAVLAATGQHPSEFKRRVLRVVGETNGPPLRLTLRGFAILAAILVSIIALPWVMQMRAAFPVLMQDREDTTAEIDWKSLKGTIYERDDEFVYALHNDRDVVAVVIITHPEAYSSRSHKTGTEAKPNSPGSFLCYHQLTWDTTTLRFEFDSDHPMVVKLRESENSKQIKERQLSLYHGRIFYCDGSMDRIEQRKTLKQALPEPQPGPDAKLSAIVQNAVRLIESEFGPDGPALGISGPITDAKFIDAVAEQVARLPFAVSWQSDNAKRFARQVTRENLRTEIPEEERRRILKSLKRYVTSFLEWRRGESNDNSYVRRPDDVRNLLWRLKRALVREPLNEQSQAKLDGQIAELHKWVRTLPPVRLSQLTSQQVIASLEERQADSMEPIFKYPLPDQEFDTMMRELRKLESALDFAEPHVVWEWLNAEVRSNPDTVALTGSPDEKNISYGQHGGKLHVGYKSTEVWSGNHNLVDSYNAAINLSETVPDLRGLVPSKAVIQDGDAAVRQWYRDQSHKLGHILFDFENRRLVGVRGTRFLGLDVKSFVEADRLKGDTLRMQIRQRGRGEFVFPEPKSVVNQPAHQELIYDLYLGVLTEDERLYVLKIEKIETDFQGLSYHARLHNPPHPDEVAFADNHGSHDHDHSALTPEAKMKEVIGRFDPNYWKVVDIPQLIADRQIAFAPDRECLALLRGETLFAIESVSGHDQSYRMTDKFASIEWNSGSIHVVTESGENRFYSVRRPRIQFVDGNDDPASVDRLMKARIGLVRPRSNWVMHSHKPTQSVSLMGLKPGTHWLVTDSRDLFAVSLPLGSRDPNLPPEVSLQGEVTERKTLSGTVREVRRRLQPQPTIQADNVSATASVKTLGNGREFLLLEIRNNSGKRLQFSEQHIYLETKVGNRYERVLSPNWMQEDSDTKWPQITIEDGTTGVMELDWIRWRGRGLWFGNFDVALDEKGPGFGEPIPGKLQVRVHGPGFGTLPVALSIPETEEPAERQPAAPSIPQSNAGDQTPPGNPAPEPIDATTLELYNRYVARVGKIESTSIDAAIELVAARSSNDPKLRELLRKDFATSRQEDNQGFDSRKLLTLITKVLGREGGMRWQHEFGQRSGNVGQRELPAGDVLYRESPLLAEVIKHGRTCDRDEIDDFAFAVRQAHHPQGKQFLLAVLNNPSGLASPFEVQDKTKGKWPDNVGGGWKEACFLAAVGLAELNVEEGVRWLIEHADPNKSGISSRDFHHPHSHINSRFPALSENCDEALKDLIILADDRHKRQINWDEWWSKNKKTFAPGRVYLKE